LGGLALLALVVLLLTGGTKLPAEGDAVGAAETNPLLLPVVHRPPEPRVVARRDSGPAIAASRLGAALAEVS